VGNIKNLSNEVSNSDNLSSITDNTSDQWRPWGSLFVRTSYS